MTKIFALTDEIFPSQRLSLLINRGVEDHPMKFSKDLMVLIQSHEADDAISIIVIDKYVEEDNLVKLSELLGVIFDQIIFLQNAAVQDLSNDSKVSFARSPPNFRQEQKRTDGPCQTCIKAHPDFSNHFFIRCEKSKIIRIETADILFVEASQNQVLIRLTNGVEAVRTTLTNIEQLLPESMFIRVHRSFIVNIQKIKIIEANQILVADRISVPIGQSYRKLIFNIFQSRVLMSLMTFLAGGGVHWVISETI